MKPEDLARECVRAITQQPDLAFIVIIGKLPQKGWPRGKLLGSDSRGRFYSYDAYKVLARILHPATGIGGYKTVGDGRVGEERTFTGEIRIAGDDTVYKLGPEQHKRMFNALHGYLFRSADYAETIPETEKPA